MRVFHFTSSLYALEAIRRQRYKLSTFDSLNDPFELFSADFSDEKLRNHFYRYKAAIAKEFGLLCCSTDWKSTLLWSHYADCHRGIALELEVFDYLPTPVVYQFRRTQISQNDLDRDALAPVTGKGIGGKLLNVKSKDWAYEKEVRIFHELKLAIKEDNLFFWTFNPGVRLVGIVLGPLCETTDDRIKACVPRGQALSVTRTRLACRSFQVVPDKLEGKRILSSAA